MFDVRMKRSRKKAGRKKAGSQQETGWGIWTRRFVSVLLLFHLLAVFVPPFTFQTSPVRGLGSPLAESLLGGLRPYVDTLYLNHGYAFFAPDPGPSYLLRIRLEYDDRPDELLMIPDRQEHWPRLLYHRHFMLSEHLNAAAMPDEPPAEVAEDPLAVENWRFARAQYLARSAAIESYIQRRMGARQATIERVQHRMLDPYEMMTLEKTLVDPDTYLPLSEENLSENADGGVRDISP